MKNQSSGRKEKIPIDNLIDPGHPNACQSIALTFGGLRASVAKPRSWHCCLRAGHDGPHASRGGHRAWYSDFFGHCVPFREQWPEKTNLKTLELVAEGKADPFWLTP